MMINEKLRQMPLLRLILPFIPGIIFFIHFVPDFKFLYLIIPVTVILVIIWLSRISRNYNLRWIYGSLVYLLLFLSGAELVRLHSIRPHLDQNKGQYILAHVKNIPVEKENSIQTILKVTAIHYGTHRSDININTLAYFQKDSLSKNIQTGDQVLIQSTLAEISKPFNPGEFDYRTYMARKKVYYQMYAGSGSWKITGRNKGDPLILLAVNFRNRLLEIYRQHGFRGNAFSVVSALTLGYRNKLDKQTITAYSGSGAMHILAVSGLHTGIIYLLLNYLFFFLRKYRYGKIMLPVLLMISLWFYAFLTGLSPSVLRAVTMFSFIIIGRSLHRTVSIYNMLAASALLLLLINPFLIMEIGFQLSYIAVAGIVYFHPRIYDLIKFRFWLLDKLWSLTVVSISAQIAVFPLVLYYFHQFPVYFIFTNIVAIPLVTVIIYMAVFLFIFSFSGTISTVIAEILKYAVNGLNYSVSFIEHLPHSTVNSISFTIPETLLVYAIIIFITIFIVYRKIKCFQIFLAAISVFTVFNIVQQYFSHTQKKIYIYNIRGSSVYNFINGKNNFLLSDLTANKNKDKILKNLRNNWIRSGLLSCRSIDIGNTDISYSHKSQHLFINRNFLQFCDKRIYILNNYDISEYRSDRKINVDYLILADNTNISIENILSNFNIKKLIIDSSNSYYFNKRMVAECKKHDLECFSVIDNGCFCADL